MLILLLTLLPSTIIHTVHTRQAAVDPAILVTSNSALSTDIANQNFIQTTLIECWYEYTMPYLHTHLIYLAASFPPPLQRVG